MLKFFFLVSLFFSDLFPSLSLSLETFFCSFLHRFVSYRLLSRSLSISRETLPLVSSSRSPAAYVFFPTRFSGIPPLLTAASEERRESGRVRETTTFLASPAPPLINFPQFVLFLNPCSVRNIIVTVLPVNSPYFSKVVARCDSLVSTLHNCLMCKIFHDMWNDISWNDIETSS